MSARVLAWVGSHPRTVAALAACGAEPDAVGNCLRDAIRAVASAPHVSTTPWATF